MSITIDTVMSWWPCYSLKKIEQLFAGRDSLSVDDLLTLPIPDADKLWVLLHPEVIPARELRELACVYAEAALNRERKAGREPDPRSWAVIEAVRTWSRGAISDKELNEARLAAEAVESLASAAARRLAAAAFAASAAAAAAATFAAVAARFAASAAAAGAAPAAGAIRSEQLSQAAAAAKLQENQ
jgi:hypothetical protein